MSNRKSIAWGHSGTETLVGGSNDNLLGDSGNDRLYGQDGEDTRFGGVGNDSLYGGNDNDLLKTTPGAGLDRMWGQDGTDLFLAFSDSSHSTGQVIMAPSCSLEDFGDGDPDVIHADQAADLPRMSRS